MTKINTGLEDNKSPDKENTKYCVPCSVHKLDKACPFFDDIKCGAKPCRMALHGVSTKR